MALTGTDLFLVARGAVNYRVTATEVAAFAGGGSITGTLPIVVTGSAISINAATNATAGSMSAADKAKLDGAATIVSSVTGTLPITVATGTSTPIIAINAASTAATGSIQLATAAEAATGTDAAKGLTPATGVPKTPADMTGALYLPGGNDAARPSPLVKGMLRYNDQTAPAVMEFYNGTGWADLATGGGTIFAWGFINAVGTLSSSYNVASSAVVGNNYNITFTTPAPTAFSVVLVAAGETGAASYWTNLTTTGVTFQMRSLGGGVGQPGKQTFLILT